MTSRKYIFRCFFKVCEETFCYLGSGVLLFWDFFGWGGVIVFCFVLLRFFLLVSLCVCVFGVSFCLFLEALGSAFDLTRTIFCDFTITLNPTSPWFYNQVLLFVYLLFVVSFFHNERKYFLHRNN